MLWPAIEKYLYICKIVYVCVTHTCTYTHYYERTNIYPTHMSMVKRLKDRTDNM